ncbi:MAG: ATP-binding cassette domain-containing protein [Planctomycetales bacterium]|nr:ATP-binding cassette domain-containing protein [Planctomycetales bacterium]
MKPWLEFDCQYLYESGFALDAKFSLQGRVAALCGPSGSGKTTVVSLIAGILKPRRGIVTLCDDTIVDLPKGVCLRPEHRRVGLTFQDRRLFPHLSVARNIAYGARRRVVEDELQQRIIDILELTNLLDRYPAHLSGGEQQRVALARALASGPRALLLDEPLSAVEAPLQSRIAEFSEAVVRDLEIPTLLISHNQQLVERLADEVVVISEGRIHSTAA